MDVPTITMDRTEARQRFLEYRHSVQARHDDEDAEVMRGYRALSQGQPLLCVSDALRQAGIDEWGRPRLAISRADHPFCWFRRDASTGHVYFAPDDRTARNRRAPNGGTYPDYLQFRGVYNPEELTWQQRNGMTQFAWRHRTLVPRIPPSLRPKLHLRNFHVLFEPDGWEQMPDPDPMLLKRVSHDLYAVLAVWDMTPVEMAVLGRRFTQLP